MDSGEIRAIVKALDIMLNVSSSFDQKLQRMLGFVVKSLKSENGSIMIVEGDKLVVKASMKPHLIGKEQNLTEDSISIRVFKESVTLKVDNLSKKSELSSLMRRPEEDKSAMFISATIMTQSGPVGIFNISDKTDRKPYSKKETETLLRWVLRISPIVESAKLNHDLKMEEKKLKKANRMLRKLENLKRDLVNMVIHDMKSPLSEISANLELLKEMQLNELSGSYLESATIGAGSLTRMIGNVLDVSRMEEGHLSLKPELINVAELVQETVDKSRSIFELNDLETRVEIKGEQKELKADRLLIERVLSNLFTNAMEHSPINGLVKVDAVFHNDRSVVEFRVEDQGRGIPKEAQKLIFRKFYQTGEKKERGGSGLGLAFCNMAVKAHKGKIWVESEVDKGSVFAFELPLAGLS